LPRRGWRGRGTGASPRPLERRTSDLHVVAELPTLRDSISHVASPVVASWVTAPHTARTRHERPTSVVIRSRRGPPTDHPTSPVLKLRMPSAAGEATACQRRPASLVLSIHGCTVVSPSRKPPTVAKALDPPGNVSETPYLPSKSNGPGAPTAGFATVPEVLLVDDALEEVDDTCGLA
jgi:hypothetical protein